MIQSVRHSDNLSHSLIVMGVTSRCMWLVAPLLQT